MAPVYWNFVKCTAPRGLRAVKSVLNPGFCRVKPPLCPGARGAGVSFDWCIKARRGLRFRLHRGEIWSSFKRELLRLKWVGNTTRQLTPSKLQVDWGLFGVHSMPKNHPNGIAVLTAVYLVIQRSLSSLCQLKCNQFRKRFLSKEHLASCFFPSVGVSSDMVNYTRFQCLMYQSIPKPPIPPRAIPGHLTRVKLRTVGNLTQNEARLWCQNVCQRSEVKGFRNSLIQQVSRVHGSLLLSIPRGFFRCCRFV